jgi:hypothetical protein
MFSLLNSVREFWQNCGIWSRIEAIKAIFIEPQRKDALTAVMKGIVKKNCDPVLFDPRII